MRFFSTILLFISISFCNLNCNKKTVIEEQLPPETQTGAHTFGCLVNDKIFLPSGMPFINALSSVYENINGKYNFRLSGQKQGSAYFEIKIIADSLQLQQGSQYSIKGKDIKGALSASYIFKTQTSNSYFTNSVDTGQLIIKKLDEVYKIISGTFWFNATDSFGQKVQIHEGRFDLKYDSQ